MWFKIYIWHCPKCITDSYVNCSIKINKYIERENANKRKKRLSLILQSQYLALTLPNTMNKLCISGEEQIKVSQACGGENVITLTHLHNMTLPIKTCFPFQTPLSDGIV